MTRALVGRSVVVAALCAMAVAFLMSPAVALVRDPRRPVPIVLDRSQFQGACDVAVSRSRCAFWYNNGSFAIGDANFAFLNLDQWGVRKRHACEATGPSAIGRYIVYRYPRPLEIHPARRTYVCSYTGRATDNWQDLVEVLGESRFFPVNDCDQQVSSSGEHVPCGTGTPDKFSIVGFARFRFEGVYKGNDPLAIGTPGTPAQTGMCGWEPLGLRRDGTRDLEVLARSECGVPPSVAFDSVPYADVQVRSHDGTVTYAKCPPIGGTGCDYTYDEPTFTITWVDPTTKAQPGKQVSFTWHVDGTAATPGVCGVRSSDPNSICLVLAAP